VSRRRVYPLAGCTDLRILAVIAAKAGPVNPREQKTRIPSRAYRIA